MTHFPNRRLEEDETYRGRGYSWSFRLRLSVSVLGSISGTVMANTECTWLCFEIPQEQRRPRIYSGIWAIDKIGFSGEPSHHQRRRRRVIGAQSAIGDRE